MTLFLWQLYLTPQRRLPFSCGEKTSHQNFVIIKHALALAKHTQSDRCTLNADWFNQSQEAGPRRACELPTRVRPVSHPTMHHGHKKTPKNTKTSQHEQKRLRQQQQKRLRVQESPKTPTPNPTRDWPRVFAVPKCVQHVATTIRPRSPRPSPV